MIKGISNLILPFLLLPTLYALDNFVTVNETEFYLNGTIFYFAGTNNYYLWYGNWDCVSYDHNQGCSKEVMDEAKEMNLTVLRVWGFSDGYNYWGSLQPSAGIYSDGNFTKYDRLIKESADRGLKLMIPLVNNWDAYGGMCQYVEWCGLGSCNQENAAVHDLFYTNNCTKALYKQYVAYFLNRTNTLTGIKYKDDPTIFAWQLANEPRARSDTSGQTLYNWITEMSSYIKSIDPNHLLTAGEDGFYKNKSTDYGYAGYDGQDFISHHQISTIDFASMHMYPWVEYYTYENMLKWIEDHAIDAKNIIKKPVTLNEFGVKGSLREEQMHGFYQKIEDFNINGDIFWILCDDSYPDYDEYCVYYPADSAVSVITNHANIMKNKNFTNNFPTIKFIDNIIVNETQLVTIVVNATDPDGDSLTYFISDNRYTQNNNTFSWQTQEEDYGIYYTTIYVNDGSRVNISQNFYVIVKENKPCIEPTDGMIIIGNITMCVGIYELPKGIESSANGITIDCRGSIIVGNNTGNGIYVHFDNSNIKNCEVKNYNNGLYLSYATNNYIQNNKFIDNKHYAVYVNRGSNNTIKNNTISHTNNYVGLQLYSSHNNTIVYNDISYHDKGIYIEGYGNSFSYNNIYSNSAWNIFNTGVYNVSAAYNWWGTIDRNQISDEIYDYYDNPSWGIVDFEPYLLTPYDGTEYIINKIELKGGWNLISIPLILKNASVQNTFRLINYSDVYYYNSSWLVPNEISNELGYWLKVTSDDELLIEGLKPENTTLAIKSGWNLIGHPYLEEKTPSELYPNATIYTYNGTWLSYVQGKAGNSLNKLKPGVGYWVKSE